MAIPSIWKLDKVVLPSSVEFSHVRNSRLDAGITELVENPAGHVHPMFTSVQSQKPVVEFATSELDVLLAAIGLGGASLGSTTCFLKAASVVSNTARASLAHRRVVIASSVGYWTSIRLPHNGVGEATVRLRANFDGTNAPFAYSGSVALSGNLATGTFFGAGPVAINGTTYGGVQEITIDSGIQLIEAGGESELYDTFCGIMMTRPVVTIRFQTEMNWSAIGAGGLALNGSTGLTFFARKFAADGARVANATAEHIRFVGTHGLVVPVDTNGQGSSPITDTIRVNLRANTDTGNPLAGTVSSAIT